MFSQGLNDVHANAVLILIDALDEFAEEEARKIVAYLNELSLVGSVSLRICLSSRFYPFIAADYQEMDLSHGTTDDLVKYVDTRLPPIIDKQDSKQLKRVILAKASGIFLWVVLVLNDIIAASDHGESLINILDIVTQVPADLKLLFDQTMRKIKPAFRNNLDIVLKWMLFSKKNLNPAEAVSLMRFNLNGKSDEGLTEQYLDRESMQGVIRGYSGGLLEVKQSGDTSYVQFIHESVRAYMKTTVMEGHNTIQGEIDSQTAAHGQLADFCIDYLLKIPSFSTGRIEMITMCKYLNLYADRYAASAFVHETSALHHPLSTLRGWDMNHAIKYLRSVDHEAGPILRNLVSCGCYESNTRHLKIFNIPKNSAQRIVSQYKIQDASQIMISILQMMNLESLAAVACVRRSRSHRLPLDFKQQIESPYPFVRRAISELSLHAQKSHRKSRIQSRLLNVFDHSTSSSSMYNFTAAVTCLGSIFCQGYNIINLQNSIQHIPTFLRISSAFDLAICLEDGFSKWPNLVHDVDHAGLTLLDHAFMNECSQTAAIILANGGRFGAIQRIYSILTLGADYTCHRSITRVNQHFLRTLIHSLATKIVDMRLPATYLLTCFISYPKSTAPLIRYLVEVGADTDAQDKEGRCLLIQVARADTEGREDMIEALVECRANINSTDSLHRTPLHHLARSSNLSAINHIIKGRPAINMKDRHGETAWDVAHTYQYEEVMDLLTKHGGVSGRSIAAVERAEHTQGNRNYDCDQWEFSGTDFDSDSDSSCDSEINYKES